METRNDIAQSKIALAPYKLDPIQPGKKCNVGVGAFSYVYVCFSERLAQQVALKVMFDTMIDPDTSTESLYYNELEIMKTLNESNAPFTIQLIGHFTTKFKSTIQYNIVMTYASNGSLADALKHPDTLSHAECQMIMLGTSQALAHMHHHNIIHCDIKPDNILLDKNNLPSLADFGLSLFTHQSKNKKVRGTDTYLPPELLFNLLAVNNQASDIFSLALTFWEILARPEPLYAGATQIEDLQNIYRRRIRPIIPNDQTNHSKKIAALLTWGWTENPVHRPTASDIVNTLKRPDPRHKL